QGRRASPGREPPRAPCGEQGLEDARHRQAVGTRRDHAHRGKLQPGALAHHGARQSADAVRRREAHGRTRNTARDPQTQGTPAALGGDRSGRVISPPLAGRLMMPRFQHGPVEIAFLDEGKGEPIVLVHGFGSTKEVNWVHPGWIDTLTRAGRRAVALDNRGHGESSKLYDPADYHTEKMAEDVRALMDHLSLTRADVMGYSMG